MKLYSNTLTAEDVRLAFREARTADGQDIWAEDMRDFRPRSGYRHGVNFYAHSLGGTIPTGHRPIGSYPLDEVNRAASWDAYGYVIARLFAKDPQARIGQYDGLADFVRQVSTSHRREPRGFLDLVGAGVAIVDEEVTPPRVVARVATVAEAEQYIDGITDRDKVLRGAYAIDATNACQSI